MKQVAPTDLSEPLKTLEVTITYLEQLSRPSVPPPPAPLGKVALLKCERPPIAFYRHLFDAVGSPHHWVSRRYLSDEALAAKIYADTAEIYVLYKDGWPAGWAELDLSEKHIIAIKFFGLVPEAQGARLGRWFFYELLSMIWARSPVRVQIETCSADHPAALRLYQRMGFSPYDQAYGKIDWYG